MTIEHDPFDALCEADKRLVNRIGDAFENALLQGRTVRAEDFLADTASPAREVLLRELLVLECEYALDRATGRVGAELVQRLSGREDLIAEVMASARDNLATASTSPPVDAPEAVGRFGPFRLLKDLGYGAFGAVFHAVDTRDGHEVALKVAHIVTLVTPELRERFLREAEVNTLDHPRIAKIREVGEIGPACYIASEYTPGISLAVWLHERGKRQEQVPIQQAAQWTALLAEAMEHAHAQGVLHCDLKPGNVLLRDGIEPVVIDFGLARLVGVPSEVSRTGLLCGTPAYMAPEQAAGSRQQLSPATDVYGLGAILYELLVGRPPFQGENALDILYQKRHGEPVAPRVLRKVPRDLETICLTCLETQPRRRYASAAALAADLRRFLAGQRIAARRASLLERSRRWVRRRPGRAALVAVLFFVLGGGVLIGVREVILAQEIVAGRQREKAARNDAEKLFTEALQLTGDLVQLGQGSLEMPGMLYGHVGNVAGTPLSRWSSGRAASAPPAVRRERVIEVLTKAENHCRSLLRQHSQDAQARQALAEIRLYLGQLHVASGQTEQGAAAIEQAQEILEGLTHEEPASATVSLLRADVYWWLGNIHERLGKNVQAAADIRCAHQFWRDLTEKQPSFAFRRELAGCQMELILWLIYFDETQQADQLLDAQWALLEKLLQEAPSDLVLQQHRYTSCVAIANQHRVKGHPDEAERWQKRASDVYRKAVEGRPGLVRFRFHLATYGTGLWILDLDGDDPFARDMRRVLEQIGDDLAGTVYDDPAFCPPRDELAAYCKLMTHLGDRIRDPENLLQRYAWCAQVYERLVNECPGDPEFGQQLLAWLIRLELLQKQLGRVQAAQEAAERCARLLARTNTGGISELDARHLRADYLWQLAHVVRRSGKTAEALRLAEESNRLFQQLLADAPQRVAEGFGLYRSWEEIGKAHVALGRPDDALAAWSRGVEVLRELVEQMPANISVRKTLATRYLGLSRHLLREGRLADAARWLVEKEKLMPGDASNLRELSGEFNRLAAAVGKGRSDLSPAEREQRERYREQAKRLEAAATVGR